MTGMEAAFWFTSPGFTSPEEVTVVVSSIVAVAGGTSLVPIVGGLGSTGPLVIVAVAGVTGSVVDMTRILGGVESESPSVVVGCAVTGTEAADEEPAVGAGSVEAGAVSLAIFGNLDRWSVRTKLMLSLIDTFSFLSEFFSLAQTAPAAFQEFSTIVVHFFRSFISVLLR